MRQRPVPAYGRSGRLVPRAHGPRARLLEAFRLERETGHAREDDAFGEMVLTEDRRKAAILRAERVVNRLAAKLGGHADHDPGRRLLHFSGG